MPAFSQILLLRFYRSTSFLFVAISSAMPVPLLLKITVTFFVSTWNCVCMSAGKCLTEIF